MPVVRTVGWAGVRSRDYQNFPDALVTKFSYHGALLRASRARELRYKYRHSWSANAAVLNEAHFFFLPH